MPSFGNLTVKKYDGTTDVVYTAKAPAAGDGSNAIFRNETVGSTIAQQPEFRFRAQAATKKGIPYRVANSSYKWPKSITNSTTGEVTVVNGVTVTVQVEVNQTMSAADINEAVYQSLNLAAHASVKQGCRDGYSFF